VGLDKLDEQTVGELLVEAGASDAGLRFSGARRGDGGPAARASQHSALYRIWQMAVVRHRRLAQFPREVYRIRGGNQVLTDTFAARLGDRVRLGCPVSALGHGKTGVTVHFSEHGDKKRLDADYLVSALPMNMLRNLPVTPKWPEAKDYAIRNVVFSSQARVVLQCRTPFWKKDLPSANLEIGEAALNHIWATADEVPGDRAILLGTAQPKATAAEALAALRRVYPGKTAPTVEQALVHNWANDPWSSWCERLPFPLGQLRRFWPHTMAPVGRIHFAGAHADNLPWGMDAATRSANRVARAIDES
jgi:monoamine oxidase